MHKQIYDFNPDVEVLNTKHQDFLYQFDAGEKNFNFTDFIRKDAFNYTENGEGVTYLVFNKGAKDKRILIAYYTLSATAIPYNSRIRLDADEQKMFKKEFDEQTWGISSVEIKMFAVDKNYQDTFYTYEDECLPISVWILRSIIDYAYTLIHSIVGIKALFLHSTPKAEKFYLDNNFKKIEKNMYPLQCVDSGLQSMYYALEEIHMVYDE